MLADRPTTPDFSTQDRRLPPGWLTDTEAEVLRRVFAGRYVLEIGSFFGRSTVVIAQVADHVVSVDNHQGVLITAGGGSVESLGGFVANLQQHNVRHKVSVVAADSRETSRWLGSDAFSGAYVDAGHDFVSALRDGKAAIRCVASGGPIIFHDGDKPAVYAAIGRLAQDGGVALTYPGDSLVGITSP